MKLLLDTHVWLWSLLEPKRLTARAAKELRGDRNELWLSPVSVWELVVLVQKQRITLAEPVDQWARRSMEIAPLREAPFTLDVALETYRFSISHHDPADRFLVATARVFGLTLLTADARLISAEACPILAAG